MMTRTSRASLWSRSFAALFLVLLVSMGSHGVWASQEDTESAPSSTLEIVVEPEDLTVTIIGPGGFREQARSGDTLSDLPPGRYVIVGVRGQQSATRDVRLEAGQSYTVVVALPSAQEAPTEAGTEEAGTEEAGTEEAGTEAGTEEAGAEEAAALAEEPGSEETEDPAASEETTEDAGAEPGEPTGEPAAEAPAAGRGWLTVEVRPANVTINVIGPDNYTQRFTGAQTITDLEPGRYIVAASRGHESASASAMVEAGATARVSLLLDELVRSEDVPEEPAVPATEVPAIPAEPVETDIDAQAEAEAGMEGDEESEAEEETEAAEEPEAEEDTAAEPSEGWFTEEQASRGGDAYEEHCASCHGSNLEGDTAPALVGENFLNSWDTVGALFDYTRTHMPQDDPGSLEDDTYADITAYILQQNDFPTGEEELPPDQERLEDYPLDPEAAGEAAEGESEEAEGEPAEEEQQEAEEEPTGETEEAPEEEADQTQAGRGEQAYAQNCARCHGANLQGNVAPALAGPVFFERWGGHPVDWLDFQARTAMPPHNPGTLDDQTYTDIIVYILAENDLIEGHEEFETGSDAYLQFVIARSDEQHQELQEQVEALRQELHQPHDEEALPVTEPLTPDEEPVRPGAAWEGDTEAPALEGETEGEGGTQDSPTDGEGDSENGGDNNGNENGGNGAPPQEHQEGERLN